MKKEDKKSWWAKQWEATNVFGFILLIVAFFLAYFSIGLENIESIKVLLLYSIVALLMAIFFEIEMIKNKIYGL